MKIYCSANSQEIGWSPAQCCPLQEEERWQKLLKTLKKVEVLAHQISQMYEDCCSQTAQKGSGCGAHMNQINFQVKTMFLKDNTSKPWSSNVEL